MGNSYPVDLTSSPEKGARMLSGIVLGVGCPVKSKTQGKSMCAIVLGDCGLFRIYPIDGKTKLPVWSRVNVKVQKKDNDTDRRVESWRLIDLEIQKDTALDAGEKRAILNRSTLLSGAQDPIDYQNENKRSICIVRPESLGGGVKPQRASYDDGWLYSQDMSHNKPYLNWQSHQGKQHESHIVSREAYTTMMKNPDNPYSYYTNLHIGDPDWNFWLVMGNIVKFKNVWVVVHVHRLKKTTGLSIPLYCDPISGKPDVWPYSMQQDGNAPVAGAQLLMSIINDT